MSNEDNNPDALNAVQVRVLACLMEKHLATPKNYPLTPNSLTLACNQKSNRYPTMMLEEGKVVQAAQQLNELGFVSVDQGDRIVKFSHRAPGMLKVTREQQALLAMLMLREPLTLNELKARTAKMVSFESIDRVQETVEQLISCEPALVLQLPIASGQREERYTHLLAGEPDLSAIVVKEKRETTPIGDQTPKIEELEARIVRLEKALDMRWNSDSIEFD